MQKLSLALVLLLTAGITAVSQTRQAQLVKEGSSITYFLTHPLHEIEATSADATYRLMLDPATKEIKGVDAKVDVTTFDSGNSNRDSHAMEVIDGLTYPDVAFKSSGITKAGDSVQVAGALTFHGVTKDIVISAYTKWSQDRVEVDGHFDLSLTAFKVERPSLLLIPVDDTLKFRIHAAFRWE